MEAWLGGQNPDSTCTGDRYKWRLMRSNGVGEDHVTGSKPPFERFLKLAEALTWEEDEGYQTAILLALDRFLSALDETGERPKTILYSLNPSDNAQLGCFQDSRSFLSYAHHDYFRRILCNLIGRWVENGEYPNCEASLKKIVEGVCYNNAARYFRL